MISPRRLLPLAAAVATAYAASRPNVIWLQVDSMDGRLVDPTSPYSQHVRLPTMQSLAAAGVNFARTYSASPQCVPSRSATVTSHYPHEIRAWNNGIGIAQNTRTGGLDANCVAQWSRQQCEAFAALQRVNTTIIDAFVDANYTMGMFGRFDFGNGILQDWNGTTGDGFHGGPDITILSRAADIRRNTKTDPYSMVNDNATDPADYRPDEAAMGRAIDWLNTHDPTDPMPFFLWYGILAPHPPYATNATWLSQVNMSAVDVPPSARPDKDTMHPYDSYMSISKAAFKNYTDEQIKAVRMSYWGAVAEADALLGHVLAAASSSGHLNNTIVVFTSDHGEMAMEHRQDYKNAMYEGATRVPLIIAGYGLTGSSSGNSGGSSDLTPQRSMAATETAVATTTTTTTTTAAGPTIGAGVSSGIGIPAGVVITNMTSHLDIFPTLLDLIGASIPAEVRGFSLVPFLTASSAAGSAVGSGAQQRLLRGGDTGSSSMAISSPSSAAAAAAAPFPRNYAVSQYASNMGNTGSFMIRMDEWVAGSSAPSSSSEEEAAVSAGASGEREHAGAVVARTLTLRQWKYVTFGHALFPWLNATSYVDQLFDLSTDPYETNNVADDYPAKVPELRALLLAELRTDTINDIDKEAKQLDLQLFGSFFYNTSTHKQLWAAFAAGYTGFDEGDAARVAEWCNCEAPVPPTAAIA